MHGAVTTWYEAAIVDSRDFVFEAAGGGDAIENTLQTV
jgi:hypothetical protein